MCSTVGEQSNSGPSAHVVARECGGCGRIDLDRALALSSLVLNETNTSLLEAVPIEHGSDTSMN